MKGNQFPDNFTMYKKEPMLAFHKIQKPGKNQDPWPPVAFREDHALWRDSLSLFQSLPETRERPKILDWLNDLAGDDIIPLSSTYDLEVMGLVTSKAKISLWRHERIPFPLEYLEDAELVAKLTESLDIGDGAGKELERSVWNMAKLIIAPHAEKLNDNQKKEVQNLADNAAASRPYWAALGISFNRLLIRLAEDESDERAGTLDWWANEVWRAARIAFNDVTGSLDRNARWLKAVTLARDSFYSKLNIILKPYRIAKQKGGEV
jgi:CRISPR system Cascade subunit CasA